MAKLLALIGISLLALPASYYLFTLMACWTKECFMAFHPGIAATSVGFVVFVWLLGIVMKENL